ncbi:dUTP diphosphatase [Rhizobium leguminosarum]|uniref:dUTP diphosphatase n=1 Tax=Rhizobium leguminosarum TaxID=384 RepID=UPI001C92ACBB|nr:dUTP diphosphatase [Rhizobium leguminosarum]MBY2988681.1 dUTP diphosphatase [Rhizobium leguminosarum]
MVEVLFQMLNSEAQLPSYSTAGSAGMDLSAVCNVVVQPGEHVSVPTGLAVEIPAGWEAQIRPRSGHAAHHGVTVLNAPGTIDSDYRGEIVVILINLGKDAFEISVGMRIAQMVIAPAPQADIAVTSTISPSDRGSGGFGSTGMN